MIEGWRDTKRGRSTRCLLQAHNRQRSGHLNAFGVMHIVILGFVQHHGETVVAVRFYLLQVLSGQAHHYPPARHLVFPQPRDFHEEDEEKGRHNIVDALHISCARVPDSPDIEDSMQSLLHVRVLEQGHRRVGARKINENLVVCHLPHERE